MPEALQVSAEEQTAVTTALQSAQQGQWPSAIEALRPFADADQPLSVALIAHFLGQSGQAAQGIPYAEKAITGTVAVGPIAANYASWTLNDPNLRRHSVPFFQAALDVGWTVDVISQAQQLNNMGDQQAALDLLLQGGSRTFSQIERDWQGLARDVEERRTEIDNDLRAIREARAAAQEAMTADAAAVTDERRRIAGLAGETAALIQNVAAHNLAAQYAARAKTANGRAFWWTIATLIVSVAAIVLAAAFVLIGLADNHDPSHVLAKAAITVPLLALAAYLNKLGADERRDARNWTHIELQIRTAQPYLGNLPEDLREEVQAALALRFFPGQGQDPHGLVGTDSDPEEALKLIRAIRGNSS